jgi:hypothetical protein
MRAVAILLVATFSLAARASTVQEADSGDADTRGMDRRQPLPSVFAARYVQGGTGSFNTDVRIWREAITGANATCVSYAANNGTAMRVPDIVRFDEHENPLALGDGAHITMPIFPSRVLPAASTRASSSDVFPPTDSRAGDISGWMYFNLTTPGSVSYGSRNGNARPSQNWVVTSLAAEGRYQTTFDATMLATGCTPAVSMTGRLTANPIGPAPNINP